METFNYNIKKKKESRYIKFSFYVLLICGIIAAIWGVYQFNHQNKILTQLSTHQVELIAVQQDEYSGG